MTEPEAEPTRTDPPTEPAGAESERQVFAFVVEQGPNGFGAYAPDHPASFATGSTFEEAVRASRDSLATQLQLIHGMGDYLPHADPETGGRMERAGRTAEGEVTDPDLRIVLREVGPEDAPPDAPSPPPVEGPAPPPRRESFQAVFARESGYSLGYIPDLPGGIAISDTLDEAREDLLLGTTEGLQSKVDLGETIPEKRRTAEEAITHHYGLRPQRPPSPGEYAPRIETVTIELKPPRPAARMLKQMEDDALELRERFEEGRSRRRPLKPGASWTGRYAAVFEPGVFRPTAYIPDLPACYVEGDNRAEVRKNLQRALHVHLYRALSDQGTFPLPRRNRAQARAHKLRKTVEHGFDPEDDQGAHETGMISVTLRAPHPDSR